MPGISRVCDHECKSRLDLRREYSFSVMMMVIMMMILMYVYDYSDRGKQAHAEDFFLPYLWTIVYDSAKIVWYNAAGVRIFSVAAHKVW